MLGPPRTTPDHTRTTLAASQQVNSEEGKPIETATSKPTIAAPSRSLNLYERQIMQSKLFHRLVLEAYDIHNNLRPALAKLPCAWPIYAGAKLNEQFNLGLSPATDPELTDFAKLPSHEAHQVDLARRLGVGVLVAEYLQRESDRTYDLWTTPVLTPFLAFADRTVQSMLRARGGNPRELPEVTAACTQLATLLTQFHDLMADQQVCDLTWHAARAGVGKPVPDKVHAGVGRGVPEKSLVFE
jgi:hypothetical protein